MRQLGGSGQEDEGERGGAHLDHVGMAQFAEELDLADGRHVEAVLELADLDLRAPGGRGVEDEERGGGGRRRRRGADLFDGDLAACSELLAEVDDGVGALADLLVL